MGQLVFQATLGGQVNLVGPNTASTYNINVPAVAGNMVTTGDTGTVTNTMCASSVYTAPGTIGSGTPNTGAFTTLSASGNVTFSGAGAKIAGDFTNATLTNRAAFQTTTSNGTTGIYALPNGTSTAASWQATNNSDPTNASKILIATNGSTDVQLVSGRNGTGTYLPLTFYTNGSEQMRLDTSGNLGLGVMPSAYWGGNKALEIGSPGCGFTSRQNYELNMMANAAYGTYAVTGKPATMYTLSNGGQHQWLIAPSGTAGTAITFTQAMTLDASGNLLVGTTSAWGSAARVLVSGVSSDATMGVKVGLNGNYGIYFSNQSSTLAGGIVVNSGSVAYNTTSDYRLKENVQPMTGALAKVAALKPVTYTWKADGSAGQGFIAHELQEIVPDCVTGEKDATRIEKYEISPAVPATYDEDGNELKPAVGAVMGEREVPVYQGIDTSFLVATLTAAIQELNAKVEAQAAEIAALKAPQ